MVHQLAENDPIGQGLPQVVRKRHLQLRLNGLEETKKGGGKGGAGRGLNGSGHSSPHLPECPDRHRGGARTHAVPQEPEGVGGEGTPKGVPQTQQAFCCPMTHRSRSSLPLWLPCEALP